jgi:hypothetical protein
MALNSLWSGLAEALGAVAALMLISAFAAQPLAYPSPELMRSIAEIGVALLLGYIVEAVWMVNRAERKDFHENWLGFVSGIGLAGLTGIAMALLVAAHREAGHGNLLDDLGLWWVVASMGLLGILVTLQPLVVDRWTQQGL